MDESQMHFVKRKKPPRIIYFMILFIWLWKRQNSADNRVVVQVLGVGAGLVTKKQHKIIWGERRELFCILIEVLTTGLYIAQFTTVYSPTHKKYIWIFCIVLFFKTYSVVLHTHSYKWLKSKRPTMPKFLNVSCVKYFTFQKRFGNFLES